MGIAPELRGQLVIKRTFIEFVEENSSLDGLQRPRSLTDSSICFTSTSEKVAVRGSSEANELGSADGTCVNQSATEELKAFLGLDCPEVSPSSPPCRQSPPSPTRSSCRRSPTLPAVHEEQPPGCWSGTAPITPPECSMALPSWCLPVAFDTKPRPAVLQISNMISPPVSEEQYMPCQWPSAMTMLVNGPTYMSNYSNEESIRGTPSLEEQNTTVILRNLPNNYTRDMLVNLLDSQGFSQKYDFVYIPMDFSSQAGLGYAFVNLVSPRDALSFWEHFEGFRKWCVTSEKVGAMNWSSPIQGFEAYVQRYRNSPVMHEAVPDGWKPAIYFQGKRIVFPRPTKSIKAPKMRSNRALA